MKIRDRLTKSRRKKIRLFILCFGAVLSVVIGFYFNAAWINHTSITDFLPAVEKVIKNPFAIGVDGGILSYVDSNTPGVILFFLFVHVIAFLMWKTRGRKTMPGKEYGSAEFAEAGKIAEKFEDEEPQKNRTYSEKVRISMNTRKTKINNNVLIIGGSGSGKTFSEVKPNLMNLPDCSFVVTDPKGEITRACAGMLKRNGYNVKVLNLMEMEKSDRYNPFMYIKDETDVVKLVTNLINNTTPKETAPTDPFWIKAEGMFLQALFLYVWLEMPLERRNFRSVMELIGKAEVKENKKEKSALTKMMEALANGPLGTAHPALVQYRKCMSGAGDTIRSIIISANSRLAYLENSKVLDLLSADDMNLQDIGIGVNGDGHTKTALFCIIPDSDKSYNFIVGLLYTQIFQELYYQADFTCGGKLPIHVTFMLDEFCNVALPDDFCSLLSTMRSREISSVIIIQNLAQIKALFKDTWETIPGNCDTLVYLGGNELSTHEYISKLLGKSTIDKSSHSETKSRNGSTSRNFDIIGRELMTVDEARKMENKYCLLFIRGQDPVLDKKFSAFKHPNFNQSEDGGAEAYIHKPERESKTTHGAISLLNQRSVDYFLKAQEKGRMKVNVMELSYKELLLLKSRNFQKLKAITEEKREEATGNKMTPVEKTEKFQENAADSDNESSDDSGMKPPIQEKKQEYSEALYELFSRMEYSFEQMEALRIALEEKLSEEQILEFYKPENTPDKMIEFINMHKK